MAEYMPDWAIAARLRRPPERNPEEDFAESVGTQEALRSGKSPNESMLIGFQSRKTLTDPLFDLKKLALQTQIAERAKNIADAELSRQIRQKQLDDEAADNLTASRIAQMPDNDQRLDALNTAFWKSARGTQNAQQWRMQIQEMRQRDWITKEYSKLPPEIGARVKERIDAGESPATVVAEESKKHRETLAAEKANTAEEKARRQIEFETARQTNRMDLETFRQEAIRGRNLELEKLRQTGKTELGSRLISKTEFVNRHLNAWLAKLIRENEINPQPKSLEVLSRQASDMLGRLYDELPGGTKPVAQPNVTEDEYESLKPGDLFWWNGKQIPKK